jgi:hypothetical protein
MQQVRNQLTNEIVASEHKLALSTPLSRQGSYLQPVSGSQVTNQTDKSSLRLQLTHAKTKLKELQQVIAIRDEEITRLREKAANNSKQEQAKQLKRALEVLRNLHRQAGAHPHKSEYHALMHEIKLALRED